MDIQHISLDTQIIVIVKFVTASHTQSYLPSQSIRAKSFTEIFKFLLSLDIEISVVRYGIESSFKHPILVVSVGTQHVSLDIQLYVLSYNTYLCIQWMLLFMLVDIQLVSLYKQL